MNQCPLCQNLEVATFQSPAYRRCKRCLLIWKVTRPSPTDEKARYLTHRNDPADPGYRNFLAPAVRTVTDLFPIGAAGLDFGSGPTPVLSDWLRQEGYEVDSFDPFFAPEGRQSSNNLDFVCCIETAEHFFHPAIEFETMFSKLKAGGALILMTELFRGQNLMEWWYARDLTHVCFYSTDTLQWIARHFGARLQNMESHHLNSKQRLFVFVLDSGSRTHQQPGNQIDKNP